MLSWPSIWKPARGPGTRQGLGGRSAWGTGGWGGEGTVREDLGGRRQGVSRGLALPAHVGPNQDNPAAQLGFTEFGRRLRSRPIHLDPVHARDLEIRPHGERSEERRVGKECRSRWEPHH